MESFGITALELVTGLIIGLLCNTISMWIVACLMLSIPGVRFKTCIKTAAMFQVVLAVMSVLSLLFGFIPFGGILWLICTFFALKATIEGTLDVPSGGGMILILFVVIQLTTFYLINQATA